MKNQQIIVGIVGMGIVVGAALLWLNRQTAPAPSAAAPEGELQVAAPQPGEAPQTASVAPAPVVRIAPQVATVVTTEDAQGEKLVRVRTDQVLATVNGVALTLRDLAVLEGTAEQTMSPEIFDSLLDRAVARELAFQVAKAQQVTLASEQSEQLKAMRASLEQSQPSVTYLDQADPSRLAPDKVEFELRDAAGQMLQANLAAKAGLPSPFVNAERVQQYYAGHKTEYGELPTVLAERDAAWSKLDADIRSKLSPQVQAEYKAALQAYLAQLKATAQITLARPSA